MTKRIVFIVLGLVFLLGLVANAEHVPVKKELWDQIDKENKFLFRTYDYSGNTNLIIAGMDAEPANEIVFSEDPGLLEHIQDRLDRKFGDRMVLVVFVKVPQDSTGYKGASHFTFHQNLDNSQRVDDRLGFNDYIAIDDNFFNGLGVEEGEITKGYIAIPSEIDTDKPFEIRYWHAKVTM